MASFNEPHQTVFMRNIFTMVSSFRHTAEIERALWKACTEKNATKAHVIYCCLTGEDNLNRYLDSFDEEDLKWCYEQKLRILHDRRTSEATLEAAEGHERVDLEFARKVSRKRTA